MMATKAKHPVGDLSLSKPCLCIIDREEGDYYVGSWVLGFCVIDMKFPKVSTRELTEEEVKHWNGRGLCVGNRLVEVIQIASAG
jgi:hypothetical protein